MEILGQDVRFLAGEASTRDEPELRPPAVERLNGGTTKSLASQRVEDKIRLQGERISVARPERREELTALFNCRRMTEICALRNERFN